MGKSDTTTRSPWRGPDAQPDARPKVPEMPEASCHIGLASNIVFISPVGEGIAGRDAAYGRELAEA